MTRDEVRELFDALTTPGMEAPYDQDCEEDISALERAFAAVAAAEREACAQVAHSHGQSWDKAESCLGLEPWALAAKVIEDAIRSRGEK
jgi:hypothetical protein